MISFFIGILTQLYTLTGNLGLAIIAFTLLVRFLLLPLTLPSLKAQKKIMALQPELKKLKTKHGDNKEALQKAQMELYKQYNVNPLAGCLPQLVQLGLLIVLYQALIRFLGQGVINGVAVQTHFAWLNLAQPDHWYIMPILAAVTQLILSLMIAPATEVRDVVPNQSKNAKVQAANKKEEDMADMAATMQQQMIFIMPVMIGISALRFPSGLALYWVVTTVFSIVQQWALSGPGGLVSYAQRALALVKNRAAK